MRSLFLSVVLSAAMFIGSGTATAQSNMVVQICNQMGELAANVMRLRQNNVDKYVIRSVIITEVSDPDVIDVIDAILNDAFKYPRQFDESKQDALVFAFSAEKSRQCLVVLGDTY